MAGVGEAMRLGADLGLDRSVVIDTLVRGPLGFSVGQKRAMLESGAYQPVTFSLELMRKDLELALTSARRDLPLTAAAARVVGDAVGAGHGGDDYAALAGYLADEAGGARS